ncbi:MAG: DUF547 domain-containing protein [Thalassobaculaceae bacterium]
MARRLSLGHGPARIARRTVLGGLAVATLTGFRSLEGLFAPDAEPWPRWEAHAPGSDRRVDWTRYDSWLARHVVAGTDGVTRIDYGAVSGADRAELSAVIDALQTVAVAGLDRDQQFAFWANLYNAVTLKVVLDHYPVASIKDIDLGGGVFGGGPWKAALVTVDSVALSLNDIEHRILRPIWRDPRIHYAVNCAAVGCPNLRGTAWHAETLERDLDAAARAFVNHPRGVRPSSGSERDGLVVSKIYDWFAEDFGGDEAGVLAHLQRYAEGETAGFLAERRGIKGTAYDWSLNDLRAGR